MKPEEEYLGESGRFFGGYDDTHCEINFTPPSGQQLRPPTAARPAAMSNRESIDSDFLPPLKPMQKKRPAAAPITKAPSTSSQRNHVNKRAKGSSPVPGSSGRGHFTHNRLPLVSLSQSESKHLKQIAKVEPLGEQEKKAEKVLTFSPVGTSKDAVGTSRNCGLIAQPKKETKLDYDDDDQDDDGADAREKKEERTLIAGVKNQYGSNINQRVLVKKARIEKNFRVVETPKKILDKLKFNSKERNKRIHKCESALKHFREHLQSIAVKHETTVGMVQQMFLSIQKGTQKITTDIVTIKNMTDSCIKKMNETTEKCHLELAEFEKKSTKKLATELSKWKADCIEAMDRDALGTVKSLGSVVKYI